MPNGITTRPQVSIFIFGRIHHDKSKLVDRLLH